MGRGINWPDRFLKALVLSIAKGVGIPIKEGVTLSEQIAAERGTTVGAVHVDLLTAFLEAPGFTGAPSAPMVKAAEFLIKREVRNAGNSRAQLQALEQALRIRQKSLFQARRRALHRDVERRIRRAK